jgi:hypothetical protein
LEGRFSAISTDKNLGNIGPTMTSKPALYKLSVSRRADDTLVIRLAEGILITYFLQIL